MDFYLRTKKDYSNELHVGRPDTFWGQGENDLAVDFNGDFALTEGVDNLRQGLAKILVTERGNNVFTESYGSLLQSFVGLGLDMDYLRAKIKTDIIDTLRIYQFINRNNPDEDEQVDTLKSLRINLSGHDGIEVSFNVITVAGNSVGGLITFEG